MSLDHASNRSAHPRPLSAAPPVSGQRANDGRTAGTTGAPSDSGDGIHPLGRTHLGAVARLFREVFPDNPLALLGHRFVEDLLGAFITTPGGRGLIYLRTDEVAGFVVGSENSQQHRRNLLRHHWPSLLRQVALGLLRYPSCVWPTVGYLRSYVLEALRSNGRGCEDGEALPPASLVFLGVDRRYRRSGIATVLTEAFLREMGERGVDGVKLVVGATNREALRFYLSRGWRATGFYPTPIGGVAYRLTYNLRPNRPASMERRASSVPPDLG